MHVFDVFKLYKCYQIAQLTTYRQKISYILTPEAYDYLNTIPVDLRQQRKRRGNVI